MNESSVEPRTGAFLRTVSTDDGFKEHRTVAVVRAAWSEGRHSKEDTMAEATTTTDHEAIRAWVEDRDGRPTAVRTGDEGGILRIDFGDAEEALEPIEWDEFFRIFDDNNLAFLHQEEGRSRFNKFVERDSGN
jgi:hypothetical protein